MVADKVGGGLPFVDIELVCCAHGSSGWESNKTLEVLGFKIFPQKNVWDSDGEHYNSNPSKWTFKFSVVSS